MRNKLLVCPQYDWTKEHKGMQFNGRSYYLDGITSAPLVGFEIIWVRKAEHLALGKLKAPIDYVALCDLWERREEITGHKIV